MSGPRVLLASNAAYWPSVGGSETVLRRILEGTRHLFDRVVVFAPSTEEETEHGGVEVRRYSMARIQRFAMTERPAVYFPNMVHSPVTYRNIGPVSRVSGRTVLNMIGGYPADTPLRRRARFLRKAQRYADVAVHVDPLSSEYLIDRAINPTVPYRFIPQGLDHAELDAAAAEPPDDAGRYFAYAHNLWHWKAPDVFIEQVAGRLPDLRFKVIASDRTGDVIEQTRRLAERHENVEVLLGLPREDFIRTLAGAAALVSTSTIEGAQPNILLEAGYLRVPYLSLSPGQNYGHYPHAEMYGDLAALVERIGAAGYELRDQKAVELDRARAAMGAPEWSWDSVVERFGELFSEPAGR